MAPFIPFTNVAQLNAIYKQNGERVENVFHFQGGAAWTAVLLASLANAYQAFETASLKDIRSDATVLQNTVTVDLTTQDGPFDDSTWNIQGTDHSGPLPNNCSVAVKWLTAKRGRSFRGRTYWVGLCENERDPADSNGISATFAALLVARYSAFLANAWPNGSQVVVASRRHNNAPRLVGVATPITAVALTDATIDSQRRRLPFHNVHR